MFLALAAIENAVAVNPDLDISGFIRPQTASWSGMLFDLFGGGIQACGITFGTLAQAGKDSRFLSSTPRIVLRARYQGM